MKCKKEIRRTVFPTNGVGMARHTHAKTNKQRSLDTDHKLFIGN